MIYFKKQFIEELDPENYNMLSDREKLDILLRLYNLAKS